MEIQIDLYTLPLEAYLNERMRRLTPATKRLLGVRIEEEFRYIELMWTMQYYKTNYKRLCEIERPEEE